MTISTEVKKFRRRHIRIPQFAIAILTALIAAGAARAETIGFAQVGRESDWRTAFSADMKAEAARRGIKLLFSDADNNTARQQEAVREFIAASCRRDRDRPSGGDRLDRNTQACQGRKNSGVHC